MIIFDTFSLKQEIVRFDLANSQKLYKVSISITNILTELIQSKAVFLYKHSSIQSTLFFRTFCIKKRSFTYEFFSVKTQTPHHSPSFLNFSSQNTEISPNSRRFSYKHRSVPATCYIFF